MKQEWNITSHSPEETRELAQRLGKRIQRQDVITLEGELGAGKTTFAKGLAAAVGVTRTVNSPTFTIIKEYEGRIPFYHMDTYRIEDELEDLGLDEYFEGDGVTVIEWPTMIGEQLPANRLQIIIEYKGNESRAFRLIAHGKRYETLCKELVKS